jgi:hypothetical protein
MIRAFHRAMKSAQMQKGGEHGINTKEKLEFGG